MEPNGRKLINMKRYFKVKRVAIEHTIERHRAVGCKTKCSDCIMLSPPLIPLFMYWVCVCSKQRRRL